MSDTSAVQIPDQLGEQTKEVSGYLLIIDIQHRFSRNVLEDKCVRINCSVAGRYSWQAVEPPVGYLLPKDQETSQQPAKQRLATAIVFD